MVKEKKDNNMCLYTCTSYIDVDEYKKMIKYFPKKTYRLLVWDALIKNSIFSLLIALIYQNIVLGLAFFIICQIIIMTIYYFKIEYFAGRIFQKNVKKNSLDTNFNIEFYRDCFIQKSDSKSFTIGYSEINKCIETDDNFYLEYYTKDKIVIFQKSSCDLDLISFIRENFENFENHIGDNYKFKGVKRYHNTEFIRKIMIILFVVTIASLWLAVCSFAFLNIINPQYGLNLNKNMWIFWCWLPIPLLSIIFGFKYKRAGLKCTKNIVAGFIIGFLLLSYGSFSVIISQSDYEEINLYKDVIKAELPETGQLEIQKHDTYFENDKLEYTTIKAYYNGVNTDNLVNSIENLDYWILSKNIKSELKIFIPSLIMFDDDSYFSIYNETTNEYNKIPEIEGTYQIYTMMYDRSDKKLEIHKFKYLYK